MQGFWVMLLLGKSCRIFMQMGQVMHSYRENCGISMHRGQVMLLSEKKMWYINAKVSGDADF